MNIWVFFKNVLKQVPILGQEINGNLFKLTAAHPLVKGVLGLFVFISCMCKFGCILRRRVCISSVWAAAGRHVQTVRWGGVDG